MINYSAAVQHCKATDIHCERGRKVQETTEDSQHVPKFCPLLAIMRRPLGLRSAGVKIKPMRTERFYICKSHTDDRCQWRDGPGGGGGGKQGPQ